MVSVNLTSDSEKFKILRGAVLDLKIIYIFNLVLQLLPSYPSIF